MNKTALKNLAIHARKELIEKVTARAFQIGITEASIKNAQSESSDAIYINGKLLSAAEREQREKLISRMKEIGYKQVIEEVAYTWFNRFTALRFMEVNDYLDIDKESVYEPKLNPNTEELYKCLVIKQCNSLHQMLPFVFDAIEDYKQILFPEGLLTKESFVHEISDLQVIPGSDWGQVEIMGWLYQYYISDKKDQIFTDLKKNIKISKENIPAATQLFTPRWIVKYMVENALGRIWLESDPSSPLKSKWKYYLEDAEQEDKVMRALDKLRYKRVNPEDITFIDPCCGSGHILVYAFDVFYDMYLERGYGHQEIAKLILEKNLFGLDLDDRAVRLASFALMMKAREKNRSMFGQASKLHVCTIQQSNWLKAEWMNEFAGKQEPDEQGKLREMLTSLRDTFEDAKEYGSILKVKPLDLSVLESAMEKLANELEDQGDILERIAEAEMLEKMPALLRQYKMLAATYDVVCTNPPYMGGSGMGAKLSEHVKNNYPDSRADLFAVFIESCGHMVKNHGFQAMITQHAWMFLSRYKKLRGKLIQRKLVNMLHLGAKAFEEIGGEVVQTTAFVLRKGNVPHFNSTFVRLVEYDQAKLKEEKFLQGKDRYITQTENFAKIPGVPFAYWSSSTGRDIFANNPLLKDLAVTRKGMATGLNAEFVRSWYEVEFDTIGFSFDRSTAKHSNRKWFPYANGGEFKKWYGNYTDVVNWENDGYRLQTEQHESGRIRAVNRNLDYIFTEGLCWTSITSSNFSTRLLPKGFLFSSASNALFSEENAWYYLGLLNSKVFSYLSRIINSTLNANPGDISKIPVKFNDRISRERVNALVEIAKEDWNSSEVSWDFTEHPFLKYRDGATEIRQAFQNWCTWAEHRFNQLRAAEAELNTLFIETYGLQKELSAEVDETDVTISRAEQNKDMKSFISYAIGCMFGRYSLDQEGLICAGGLFDPQAYRTFKTNEDNIVPITTNAYFDNEVVLRLVEFVKVTFGEKALAENLEFIAESLGKKNRETSMETIGRYLINDFFKDHVQMYKKKPIYWLFTSGKQKAFHCLVYIHRYDRSTLSKIRTDYVQKLQALLEVEKRLLLRIIEEGGPAPKISNAKKELNIVVLKIDELQNYEERLHYMADLHIELNLDDGVSRNYAIFTDLLAKID